VIPGGGTVPEGGTEVVGTVTVTEVEALLLASALLVAVTVAVPAEDGAVNNPLVLMVPAEAVQVTEVFVAVPWTVSLN
jgi:hypothetical protein